MASDQTTVAGVMAERMAERLRLYRSCVGCVARGEQLRPEDAAELPRIMRALGLPSFAFKRDVLAVRAMPRLCSHRRAELAVNHPQLFIEVEAWVRDRARSIARQGCGRRSNA